MQDELARSKTLQLNNLDKPYFIQYTTSDTEEVAITGQSRRVDQSSSRMHFAQPADRGAGRRLQVRQHQFRVFRGLRNSVCFRSTTITQAMRSICGLRLTRYIKLPRTRSHASGRLSARSRILKRRPIGARNARADVRAGPSVKSRRAAVERICCAGSRARSRLIEPITASQRSVRSISLHVPPGEHGRTTFRVPQEIDRIRFGSALAPDGTASGIIASCRAHPVQSAGTGELTQIAQQTADETELR